MDVAVPDDMRVTVMCCDPAKKLLAVGTHDGAVAVWDGIHEMWRRMKRYDSQGQVLNGHNGVVSQIVLSPDGKRVATMGSDKRLLAWDIERDHNTCNWGCSSPLMPDQYEFLVHSPTGNDIAYSMAEGLQVADLVTGMSVFIHDCKHITGIAYSPTGKEIALATCDAYLLLSADTGAVLGEYDRRSRYTHTAPEVLAVSRDASQMAITLANGELMLWEISMDTPHIRRVSLARHSNEIKSMLYLPDSSRLSLATSYLVTSKGFSTDEAVLAAHGWPTLNMDIIMHQTLLSDDSLWIAGIHYQSINGPQTVRIRCIVEPLDVDALFGDIKNAAKTS